MAQAITDSRSSHHERRGLGWLMSASALLALYAKIRANRKSSIKHKMMKSSISSKKTTSKKRSSKEGVEDEGYEQQQNNEEAAEPFGEGGVWQRSILMGGKCDPLNFSGVMYYDEKGKQLNELHPRSPRLNLLPHHGTEDERRQNSEDQAAGLFGDGGVWQRSILMGGKCDPLNFSGVIYYDEKGRQLNELSSRPRAMTNGSSRVCAPEE